MEYWVSGGVPRVIVPDVTGMSAAAAAAKLNGDGLIVGTSTSQASDTVPIGEVISETPAAGTQVDKGSSVNLIVSSGPTSTSPSPSASPIPVPDVGTMDQTTAENTLVAAGFAVKSVIVSSVQPLGTVVDQDPKGGVLAVPGSKVTIFVSG